MLCVLLSRYSMLVHNIVKMLSACDQNICGEDESEGENQLVAKKKGKIEKNTKFAFVFKYYAFLFKIK